MDLTTILNKVAGHTPSILGNEQFSKSAVLLPLIEEDDVIKVLFEVRSQEMRSQPGDICFPGGRMEDEDTSEKDTAIRETKEELGLSDAAISDILPLDYLINPFGIIIYPFAGFINDPESIEPNPSEVGEIIKVPLSFFLKTEPEIYRVNLNVQPDADFPFELIAGGQNYNWRTGRIDEYFYVYEDYAIWGLTAKILSHFVALIR